MNKLKFTGETTNGEMDMDLTDMVCVPSKPTYSEVDICLKADNNKGMNLAVGEIVGNWLTFDEKKKLGYEIAKRWNEYSKLKPKNNDISCICLNCVEFEKEMPSLDCACDSGPIYNRDSCMDCEKRHFCDVTKNPNLYIDI